MALVTRPHERRDSGAGSAIALSVVIVTHRRLQLLARCLESVFAAALPADAEVLVVVNGPDPASDGLLRDFAGRDARVLVLSIPATSPAGARNAAMARANGDVVYFLDDDVTIVPDLFARALRVFAERADVGVVGGPNLTPPDSGRFEHCVGRVLESPFGSASVSRRYRRRGGVETVDDRALILCNLAIRRSAFGDLEGPFPEHVVCNEENILLAGLAARGVRMLHDPDLVVYHLRRGTLAGFCRQIFKYGRGRWQNTLVVPDSLSPMFLVPVVFLLYLVSLPLAPGPLYFAPLAAYVALLAAFSIQETLRVRDPRCLPLFMILFPACHLSYATGFLGELVQSVRGRGVRIGERAVRRRDRDAA